MRDPIQLAGEEQRRATRRAELVAERQELVRARSEAFPVLLARSAEIEERYREWLQRFARERQAVYAERQASTSAHDAALRRIDQELSGLADPDTEGGDGASAESADASAIDMPWPDDELAVEVAPRQATVDLVDLADGLPASTPAIDRSRGRPTR